MRRFHRAVMVIASAAAFTAASWPDTAFAQRGRPADPQRRPPAAQRARPVDRRNVVFIGGYFYDPFFGPYPWWSRAAYPLFAYPVYYDVRAVVRIEGDPDRTADPASVYVDGFFAGVVEDFDGFFEGLPLTPGGHEIVFYMEGFRTVRHRVYLSPGATFSLRYTPDRLPAGATSEPPMLAAPLPPPPAGTYLPPFTVRHAPAGAPRSAATTGVAEGTLRLRVEPVDAEVRIDGEPWASSEPGRFVVQVAAGTHRIEVIKNGYRTYSAELRVAANESSRVNVSLAREQP